MKPPDDTLKDVHCFLKGINQKWNWPTRNFAKPCKTLQNRQSGVDVINLGVSSKRKSELLADANVLYALPLARLDTVNSEQFVMPLVFLHLAQFKRL